MPSQRMTKLSVAEWHLTILLKSNMQPFDLTASNREFLNEHGLSNEYTHKETGLYEYAPRPTCSQKEDCGSDYLFCWRNTGTSRCVSKIQPGGKCAKFEDNVENPCYNGVCVNGVCHQNGKKPLPEPFEPQRGSDWNHTAHNLGIHSGCEDKHECCFLWAEAGECEKKPRYMNIWCPGSCRYNMCSRSDFVGGMDLDEYCPNIVGDCERWVHMNPDECRANPMWMAHNCRRTCDKCHIPRRQACSGVKPKDF